VVLADGQKALIAQNAGTLFEPKLTVRTVLEAERNPATHEQGTDRPGRTFGSAGQPRSAVEQTDWHEQAETAFARKVAGELDALSRATEVGSLVLVAAPRTLANLRTAMTSELRNRTVSEIDKDLTNHPVPEVERILAAL
jgi:protein required for attachment to host cells